MQVASWHVAKHIQSQNPHVAILLPTSGMFPVALTAIWSLGKTVVPLNYLLSKKEIKYIIEDSGVDTIITVGAMLDFIGELPTGVKTLRLDEMSFKGFPPVRFSVKSDGEMLAALLYTSGTSGNPKGVMLTANNLNSNLEQCISKAGFSKKDVFLGLLPQFHSFGFTVTTLLPAVIGSKTVYLAKFNPRKVLEILKTHRPTIMVAIPSMYNAILNTKNATEEDFQSIQLAGSGGEALPVAVYEGYLDRFKIPICEGYGLTETSPVTNWRMPEEDKYGSVGRAVDELLERIVGEDEVELGGDEGGDGGDGSGADASTGLVNAASFRQFYRVVIAETRRLKGHGSLMYVMVDEYKAIFDEYGFEPTETLAVEISRVLKSITRGSDLVARIEDDLFCVLLQNTHWDLCKVVADKVFEKISNMSLWVTSRGLV